MDELIGWAYSPLRMKDMMSSLLERDIPHTVGRIAFTIYDGENADPAALLFPTKIPTKAKPVDSTPAGRSRLQDNRGF
ncbi:MAG: CHASE domain-containing protein [Candidatus Accumulibacter sp.]|nr:CHASE domain-containing protein [Accumulibacter sp.]